MTPLTTVVIQLVLLALTGGFAFLAASSARRAASFDLIRDFDALAHAVAKLQQVARSEKMTRVRAAALVDPPAQQPVAQGPLSHDQLRALVRARRNGATQ